MIHIMVKILKMHSFFSEFTPHFLNCCIHSYRDQHKDVGFRKLKLIKISQMSVFAAAPLEHYFRYNLFKKAIKTFGGATF